MPRLSPTSNALLVAPTHSLAVDLWAGPILYAFWVKESAAADLVPPLPNDILRHNGLVLLYVGGAPARSGMDYARLDRVIANQVNGSLASSRFRLALAALLAPTLNLQAVPGGNYARIRNPKVLTQWMLKNCMVSAIEFWEPWVIKNAVVKELNPPLNTKPGYHPYRLQMEEARDRLIAASRQPAE